MKYTNTAFEKEIYDFWADKFDVPSEALHKKCSYAIYVDDYDEANRAVIYDINDMTILRISTKLAKSLGISEGLINNVIDTDEFKKHLKQNNKKITEAFDLYDFFLDPADFINANKDNKFKVRLLDTTRDKQAMLQLFDACSDEEMDDADIYIDELDPVNYGAFDGDKLIAYCSYRMFGENICDAGVIIHPNHRNKGLGKAVTSSLVEHCFKNDIIPMCRIFDYNKYSLKIPKSLGFKMMVLVHSIKI